MDNAPYHNVAREGDFYPTTAHRKQDLVDWIQQYHPKRYDETLLKPELYDLCRELCPKPRFALDCIAEEAGHLILRTPPYHPELQPIEECWGVVKNHCARGCEFTMSGLKANLNDGFDKVTQQTCEGVIRHAKDQEDRYWAEDKIDDDDLEDLHSKRPDC